MGEQEQPIENESITERITKAKAAFDKSAFDAQSRAENTVAVVARSISRMIENPLSTSTDPKVATLKKIGLAKYHHLAPRTLYFLQLSPEVAEQIGEQLVCVINGSDRAEIIFPDATKSNPYTLRQIGKSIRTTYGGEGKKAMLDTIAFIYSSLQENGLKKDPEAVEVETYFENPREEGATAQLDTLAESLPFTRRVLAHHKEALKGQTMQDPLSQQKKLLEEHTAGLAGKLETAPPSEHDSTPNPAAPRQTAQQTEYPPLENIRAQQLAVEERKAALFPEERGGYGSIPAIVAMNIVPHLEDETLLQHADSEAYQLTQVDILPPAFAHTGLRAIYKLTPPPGSPLHGVTIAADTPVSFAETDVPRPPHNPAAPKPPEALHEDSLETYLYRVEEAERVLDIYEAIKLHGITLAKTLLPPQIAIPDEFVDPFFIDKLKAARPFASKMLEKELQQKLEEKQHHEEEMKRKYTEEMQRREQTADTADTVITQIIQRNEQRPRAGSMLAYVAEKLSYLKAHPIGEDEYYYDQLNISEAEKMNNKVRDVIRKAFSTRRGYKFLPSSAIEQTFSSETAAQIRDLLAHLREIGCVLGDKLVITQSNGILGPGEIAAKVDGFAEDSKSAIYLLPGPKNEYVAVTTEVHDRWVGEQLEDVWFLHAGIPEHAKRPYTLPSPLHLSEPAESLQLAILLPGEKEATDLKATKDS